MKLTTVLIGLTMAAYLPATPINFSGGGALGVSSATYGGVTATGYSSNGNLANLYGKGTAGGTGAEDGLGIANADHDNEIFGTDFIQLNISSLSGIIQISMASTGGDTWTVYGTNSPGTLMGATSLLGPLGSDDASEITVPGAKSYTYLDIVATTNNVLLQDVNVVSSVPEPGTLGIVGLGGVLIGLLRRKLNQN